MKKLRRRPQKLPSMMTKQVLSVARARPENYPWLYGKLRRDDKDNPKRENVSKEVARLLGIVRCNILVFKLLPRCWVDREAKGRRLLLNHLLARDVRQMAGVVLINPHPFFLNREKAPKREYFTADGYHIHRILGVRKMSKLIKVHVKKKLGAQWIGVRHCLELPQIYSCSHCTLVQPLQDKRPQVVVVPQLHPPPITMPASHRLPANDTILAVPDLPNRMTGEEGLEEVPAVGSWYICRTVAAYSPSVFLDLNCVRMALRFFFFVLLKYCSHAAAKAVSRVMLTVLALLTYLTTQRFINAQQFQLPNHVDLRKSLGEKAALGCSGRVVARVYGRFPDSTLRWTLNGRRLLIDRHRHLFAGGDLTLTNLTLEDSGIYLCWMDYQEGGSVPVSLAALTGERPDLSPCLGHGITETERFMLMVPAQCTESPQSHWRTPRVGSKISLVVSEVPSLMLNSPGCLLLFCHTESVQRALSNICLVWLHNGTVFKTVKKPVSSVSLYVPKTQESDSGEWECRLMDSSDGVSWTAAWFRVKVRPRPPLMEAVSQDHYALAVFGVILGSAALYFACYWIRLSK
ncbi:hypothetical protein HPB47_008669 [Ixodes persulcatus]|uniref:Uncharacterized protein n=1 Tax=Ixodes persulcatus TaxID=34615 RepID=A0AC60P454_IXOPE|nr:hypothetical protein HPB47_008669 [Ixodes persulcatus]